MIKELPRGHAEFSIPRGRHAPRQETLARSCWAGPRLNLRCGARPAKQSPRREFPSSGSSSQPALRRFTSEASRNGSSQAATPSRALHGPAKKAKNLAPVRHGDSSPEALRHPNWPVNPLSDSRRHFQGKRLALANENLSWVKRRIASLWLLAGPRCGLTRSQWLSSFLCMPPRGMG